MANEQKMEITKEPTELEKALALVKQLQAEKSETEKQLREAKALADSKLRLAVGDSGGVSIYGLQQFPVTMKVERWHQCIDFMEKHLDKFINTHLEEIKTKSAKRQAERDADRANRQPRAGSANSNVRQFSPEEVNRLNNQMNQ